MYLSNYSFDSFLNSIFKFSITVHISCGTFSMVLKIYFNQLY